MRLGVLASVRFRDFSRECKKVILKQWYYRDYISTTRLEWAYSRPKPRVGSVERWVFVCFYFFCVVVEHALINGQTHGEYTGIPCILISANSCRVMTWALTAPCRQSGRVNCICIYLIHETSLSAHVFLLFFFRYWLKIDDRQQTWDDRQQTWDGTWSSSQVFKNPPLLS